MSYIKKSFLFLSLFFIYCARVPIELKTALEKQGKEIELIKTNYKTNIFLLLDYIETIQLKIIDDLEIRTRSKYYYEKEIGTQPSIADEDLLIIVVKVDKILDDFYTNQRVKVKENIKRKKEEFLKLNQSIENIEIINKAALEYVDSLIKLKKAKEEFAKVLLDKAMSIATSSALDPSVFKDVVNIFELPKFK